MNEDEATILALDTLGWLAGHSREMDGFLAITGLGLTELRARAADPELLGALLDYVMESDERMNALCENTGHRPNDIRSARRFLPGSSLEPSS
jgi:hypothetical protein